MKLQLVQKVVCTLVSLFLSVGCSKSTSGGGSSYDFTASTGVSLKLISRIQDFSGFKLLEDMIQTPKNELHAGPTLCSSTVCFSATALTGKYYGTGFLIQSSGNGMVAYFGQSTWSEIVGTSTSYSFDSSAPITNSGTLSCCGGTGDLASANTYIESIIYLFGYLDATFTVSGVTSNTNMNREFTVRFVLANDAITSGKRGDLLLKDPTDGIFKWMDTSVSAGGNVGAGTLVTTRPTTPVTMNTSVTNWTNPFGTTQGNQTIPVIYAPVLTSGNGVYVITEEQLKATGKTYTYSFDPTNFVMFPMLTTADKNSLYSYYQLLANIHLGGLPHSGQTAGVGSPAGTVLTVN